MTHQTRQTYKNLHQPAFVVCFALALSAQASAQTHGAPVAKTAVTGVASEFSRIQNKPLTQLDMVRTEHALHRVKNTPWDLGTKGMSVYGRVLSEAERTPLLHALVVVAKEGYDAETLVRDLNASRLNPRVFADHIAWYGYSNLTGAVVIPDMPHDISVTAVSLAEGHKIAPFSVITRSGDPRRLELCPIYVSR